MSRFESSEDPLDWPPFTDDPVDRLRHTLAAFEDSGDTQRVLTASYGGVRHGAIVIRGPARDPGPVRQGHGHG